MSLYPYNEKPFSETLFREPASEYRGAPFWAWNHHLDEETIRRQVGYFKEMGMGGYHAHVRTGLDTPYLQETFMQRMQDALEEAKSQGLLHWLYDEDRWPSGAAGGLVTKDPQLAQKKLLFTAFPKEEAALFVPGMQLEHGCFYEMGRYEVQLADGELTGYGRRGPEEAAQWYAYLYLTPPSPWYNNESYADTLKPEAIRKFVSITHETYAAHFQEDFGAAIPAIFTDEPQFARKETLRRCDEKQEVSIPFTDDLEETFCEAYGESLLDGLPELFWEWQDGRVSKIRYHYHDHVCERFARAFADTVGGWCQAHGLLLTGHMMEEPTLQSQTAMLGEAMRSYRGFGLPGIDMLCDRREYTTAKQAQSASRQMGCPGVMSELYGVTNWDFDFRGHKLQGDWQAALGVTTRVPHLTWMSMEGEAKRDYPASIGFQSPWYRDYKQVEDHFARVNTAMTRGSAAVRIGVIHPIESYWLSYGSNEKTGAVRDEMDERFQNLCTWLLEDGLDFDYISESLLKDYPPQPEEAFFLADRMRYDVILVPALRTIRSSTLERIRIFAAAGGTVLYLEEKPALIDAEPAGDADMPGAVLPFSRARITKTLAPWRDVEMISVNGHETTEPGTHTRHLLYQLRRDGEERWLFVAHGHRMPDPDQPHEETVEIRVRGCWKPVLYDTLTGESHPVEAQRKDGWTVMRFSVFEHDSLLIRLLPAAQEGGTIRTVTLHPMETGLQIPVPNKVPVTLAEDNVLVLDLAEYRLDEEPWQGREEMLRLDDQVRLRLGWPVRKKEVAQPWTVKEEDAVFHRLSLRFTIRCRVPLTGLRLALEMRDRTDIRLDGETVDSVSCGWYADPCLETVRLPALDAGDHVLELEYPFGPKTNPENAFLLGDFSVQVQGEACLLDEPVRALSFGDLAAQGLPFYGGNLTYHIPLEMPEKGRLSVAATRFRAPLWKAALDQKEAAAVPYAPYRMETPAEAGSHVLHLTVCGSRINTFGQLHNCDETMDWFGPDSWRTRGPAWSYEYHLHRTGLLKRPEIRAMPAGNENHHER